MIIAAGAALACFLLKGVSCLDRSLYCRKHLFSLSTYRIDCRKDSDNFHISFSGYILGDIPVLHNLQVQNWPHAEAWYFPTTLLCRLLKQVWESTYYITWYVFFEFTVCMIQHVLHVWLISYRFRDNNFSRKNGKIYKFGQFGKILKNFKISKVWCSYIL